MFSELRNDWSIFNAGRKNQTSYRVEHKMKANLILVTVVAVLLVAGITAATAFSILGQNNSKTGTNTEYQTNMQTMMHTSISSTVSTLSNYVQNWPMSNHYYSIRTVSITQAKSAMKSVPSYARIISSNDTIIFTGSQITIVAAGMMPDDATNMTGMNPPSYATDDVFVIYGLIDPTLVIPSGANVNFVFVNLDDDMYHNFVPTSLTPPYYYMPMQGMMWSNSSSWYGGMGGGGMMGGEQASNTIFAMMMPVLSPANYTQGIAYYYATTFTLNSYGGSYWYICTYPGHAQSGMYGKIVVST